MKGNNNNHIAMGMNAYTHALNITQSNFKQNNYMDSAYFWRTSSYVESLWRRAAGYGRATGGGRPTGAALAHPEARVGGWEPKVS